MTESALHLSIIEFIIEHGYGPDLEELSQRLRTDEAEVARGLQNLQENHGIVLHPDKRSIWVIHPFSLGPTNFLVRARGMEWWGNCAWCSLGVAALLGTDATITTALGANDRQITVHIEGGKVMEVDLLVHFPIPMTRAWDNVIYTCSTMLLFQDQEAIDRWCRRHRIAKGDVQPITHVWEFSKIWYGNHLSPNWKKWSADEARAIFARFRLTGEIWSIPGSGERF